MIIVAIWTGKTFLLFLVLFLASYSDMKSRTVSDRYSLLLLLLSFIPPKPFQISGLFCSIPFLIAAVTLGGIGGADIKIMSAAGATLGLMGGVTAMVIGLISMLLFHMWNVIAGKLRHKKVGNAYPLVPFLTVGIVIVYLSNGMYLFTV